MNVYLNEVTGVDDAIVSLFMSKRTWTRDVEERVRSVCYDVFDKKTGVRPEANEDARGLFFDWLNKLTKYGIRHITLLKYIDFSITVEGLHRGGQDDWDSHAARFSNRIIRSSTRLSKFEYEMSDFYKGKIIPTDTALKHLGIEIPDHIEVDGTTYVKTTNGYIAREYKNDNDVKRGLYMMSIPSNFIFKINLAEWCHVFKERNKDGSANPEVKECCEKIADLIENISDGVFNRKFFMEVKN